MSSYNVEPGGRGGGSAYNVTVGSKGAKPAKNSGGGGGFLHALEHLPGNFAKGVGERAIGVVPGIIHLGQLQVEAVKKAHGDPVRAFGYFAEDVAKETGKSYATYYGHDPLGNIAKDPVQVALDVLTVLDLGATAGVRAGLLSGERATIATRSPRAAATGKGPVATELTSTKPLVRGRAKARAKARTTEGIQVPGTGVRIGGEMKAYGKQIQTRTGQAALGRLTPIETYQRATRKLSDDEWRALHIRAMDIHPADLATFWRGTPNAADLTPRAVNLTLNPSKRMLTAEPIARAFSDAGGELLKGLGKLGEETAAARPDLTKRQAAEVLGRPVKEITGDPYYFPHTQAPVKPTSPLFATGGGKGVPRAPGTTKQNLGVLALRGKMHLRSDLLGPEFLRRVKYVKYDEIHNALVRGALRVTPEQLAELPGGRLPKDWEFVREKASTRIPPTLKVEGETHVPIEKLIPNADDLRTSPLSEGFSTADQAAAHTSGGRYYIVPRSTVRAATGEFTRSNDFVHHFVNNPLKVWRAVVLGLRVGFLTNNLVGNSLMYGVKTGGRGALRDLFGAIVETHGRGTAKRIADHPSTPPALRADLYKEFFPDQVRGTFGLTQSPSTSMVGRAASGTLEAGKTVTGALPRLTSKVAEEYPRRALIRHYIRTSPEFKRVYQGMPKQTRSFEGAARQILEGKGGKAFQRTVSKQVNDALGDYLHLSNVERQVLRNILPFYAWYRAIVSTTFHLAVDTPLRANILGQIGQIGKQWSDERLGDVPHFLLGAIPLGEGENGTKRVLGTQGLNPYATLPQLFSGATEDVTSLGINPFPIAALQVYANAATRQHTAFPRISPADLVAGTLKGIGVNLPPARLISPQPPSRLYPNRDRPSTFWQYLGAPIKEYDPAEAARQKQAGR